MNQKWIKCVQRLKVKHVRFRKVYKRRQVFNCSHALKKDKLFKKISRVKKQVLRAELMSAPELKQSKFSVSTEVF